MKYYICILLICVNGLCSSCNKDEINNTDSHVGRSGVTVYAKVSLNGPLYMTVPLNSNFTDPGIVAKEGTETISYTTQGTVNTSVAGVYQLTYTALNKDGFPASVVRWVAVYSTDASAAGNDLSGTYLRAATGENSYWTKLAPGVYKVVNPGGAASGEGLIVIVFNPTGFTIKAPLQRSNDGNLSSTSNEVYTSASTTKYSWVFNSPLYGTSLRTFVKQ
jgi:hypothetical protein